MSNADSERLSRFVAAAVAAGCTVDFVPIDDVGKLELGDQTVATLDVLQRYPELGSGAFRPPDSPLATFPSGVITGVLGIAETGSVLVVENDLSDRLVSMMSEDLTILLPADLVRDRLEAVTSWFGAVTPMPAYAVQSSPADSDEATC
jgi:hypothetical protein